MDDVKNLNKALDFKMPFGKFRGKELNNIPNSYLMWLAENCNADYISGYADKVIKWRNKYGIEK